VADLGTSSRRIVCWKALLVPCLGDRSWHTLQRADTLPHWRTLRYRSGAWTGSAEPDTELTDDHMRLLEWLSEHPGGSLTAAAQELGLEIAEVEALCAKLVAAGMIEAHADAK